MSDSNICTGCSRKASVDDEENELKQELKRIELQIKKRATIPP